MKENILRKTIVCGIIVLFIGAGVATGINSKINKYDANEKTPDNSSVITNQNICSLTLHTFDKKEEKQNNVNLPIEVANKIYEKLEELKYMIVQKPRSDETQNLKIEFVDLLEKYDLLPTCLTKDYVLSLLNPSWIKNKQKTPKTKTILSKSYILPIAEKIINLQQNFKNYFRKTILNIFDKNTLISPSGKTTAKATFCSISSGGSGKTLPLFLLPRPRAIAVWTASDAITMVGELLTPKGFIAGGAQSGSMLGFTGMGLTYSLPGEIFYGFIGYALYTKVSADSIEFYPPNQEPVISDENPQSGAMDIPVSLSKLSFRISDADGDLMNYTVLTNPNIGSGGGNNKKDGIYTVSVSGLEGYTKYTWHVIVEDEQSTVENTFSFTTEADAPVVSDPLPPDNAKYLPVNLSQLSFNLKDFQGDPMDYTVETSPNIGSSSGNDVGDGTYTCDVNGLDYQTEYKWYVNVTDGAHWTHKVFSFQTELKMVFNPFNEGWQYRKEITINHSMVAGDLVNFPVLISTVDSDLCDKAQDDGDDILFMDGPGVANRLFHEIEKYGDSNGNLVAWVKIPSLSSSVDTIFYMYYGNPSCSNQECSELVWDYNYRGIWHLGDGGMGVRHDSTMYNNDGTPENYDGDEATTGKVDGADNFDGDDSDYGDNILIPHDSSLDGYTDWTFEGWCKPDSFGGDSHEDRIFDKDTRYAFALEDSGDNEHIVIWVGGSFFDSIDLDFITDTWYYISVTADGELGKYYVNGLYKDSDTFNIMTGGSGFLRIGSYCYYENFDGILDEIRISNTVRSSEWISTTFNSINNPTDFLSFGPEESSP